MQDQNRIVRKSNVLVEASYKLSTQEQRIILFLVSMIRPDDDEFVDYSVSVKDFSELVGVSHKGTYEDIKEITKKLIGRVFTIKSNGEELQISWLSSALYVAGKGIVKLGFDSKLKPFLLQLKSHFTKYRLHQVMQLKSSFSIRIYELLKQYQKISSRVFEIGFLRERLGIDSEQYKNFNDFKRFVLQVAQNELASKTDISFRFEEIKVGRSVGKLRFFIKENPIQASKVDLPECEVISPQKQEETILENEELLRLLEMVPAAYKNKATIKKLLSLWLATKSFDYVARNIAYANDCSNAVNPGANISRGSNYRNYLAKTLSGDFGLAYLEDMEEAEKTNDHIRKKATEEATAKKQQQEQLQREKENHERAKVYQHSLTPEALEQLRAEAFSRLDPKQQELAGRKSVAAEMILRLMMDKISLERMKVS